MNAAWNPDSQKSYSVIVFDVDGFVNSFRCRWQLFQADKHNYSASNGRFPFKRRSVLNVFAAPAILISSRRPRIA
jgi:hypothetical protein